MTNQLVGSEADGLEPTRNGAVAARACRRTMAPGPQTTTSERSGGWQLRLSSVWRCCEQRGLLSAWRRCEPMKLSSRLGLSRRREPRAMENKERDAQLQKL